VTLKVTKTLPLMRSIVGRDQSVGVRNEPKLHLDLMPNDTSFVNLSTPPRVLTLDDRPFSGFEDDKRAAQTLAGNRCDCVAVLMSSAVSYQNTHIHKGCHNRYRTVGGSVLLSL